jgi:cytochrome P450
MKYGISTMDMGRLEVGSLIGILVNTVPTVVYLLFHIFSDEQLLEDIRTELKTSIRPEQPGPGTEALKLKLKLSLSTLKDKSLLLQSVLQEVLRVYSRGVSSRLVMEDTILNNQYYLQKGSILMMPTSVIHSDPSSWGPTNFQPHRFFSSQNGSFAPEPTKRSSAASYRPFGGGATLCPGRHFASAGILALTAMIVYKYDLTPSSSSSSSSSSGGKKWSVPEPHQTSLATNIFPPKNDIEVRVSLRPGLEETKWDIILI